MTESIRSDDQFDAQVRYARSRFNSVDQQTLERYLAGQPDIKGPVTVTGLRTLTDGAGMSNGIAFFTAEMDAGNGTEVRDFVLRYDPGVSLIKQKSFPDEYLTMLAARDAGLPVPQAQWLDPTGDNLGCVGFTMERVEGDPPATSMYKSGPLAEASPERRKEMMLSAAGMLGRLKGLAIGPDKVPHLLQRGQGNNGIERELGWWLAEARLNADPQSEKLQAVIQLYDWLMHNQPSVRPATLTHGDGQIANMMFREGEIVAWLDWELSHLGYQECDLMMMIMVSELTREGAEIDGIPSEAEYIARFEAESQSPVEHFPYFQLMMVYKYLVGVLFSSEVLPNFEQYWDTIASYRDAVWTLARADAGE